MDFHRTFMGVEVPDKSVEVLRVLAENAYN
jgi:hypothetical protein